MIRARNIRRSLSAGLLSFALASSFIAVMVATPIWLTLLAPRGADWAKLSEVSQAYSAVSIPLSGIALLGAVASLFYQARQHHAELEDATRSAHRELVLRTFDNPEFFACWEPPNTPQTLLNLKRLGFVNLMISQWRSDFVGGRINSKTMTIVATRIFRGEVPREFWSLYGTGWLETMTTQGGKYKKFAEIMDFAYRAAIAKGPAVPANLYILPDGQPANGSP